MIFLKDGDEFKQLYSRAKFYWRKLSYENWIGISLLSLTKLYFNSRFLSCKEREVWIKL